MKKTIVSLAVAMLGLQAQAGNIILTEVDYNDAATHSSVAADPEKAQGEIGFTLSIADQFIYKIFNDKLTSAGTFAGSAAGSDNPEDMIDLGEITGGIGAVAQGANCASLVGLAAVANLGVTGGADADTVVTVAARTADCYVKVPAPGTKKLHLRVPLQEVALKSGGKKLVAELMVEQVAGKQFDSLVVCSGALTAMGAAVNANCDGGAQEDGQAAREMLDASTPSGQADLTAELEVTLQGAGAKSEYEAYVVAIVGLEV